MHDPVRLLSHVLAPEGQERDPCAWEDLLAAMQEVTSAGRTPEVEDLLVAALRFEGRFRLTPTSGRPHRLSPEDMVKSLAIQALGRWGAVDHIPEIERIESTARSPGLASVARSTIQRLRRVLEHSARVGGLPGASRLHTPRGDADAHDGEGRAVNGLHAPQSGKQEAGVGRLSGLAEDLASLAEPVAEPLPMNPQAASRLQEAYDAYEARDLERALALLRRWGRHLPAAQVAHLRGSICYCAEDYAAAAMFYRRAAELEPANVNYARLHLNALGISNPDEAVALAQRVLANAERYHPGLVVTAGVEQLESLREMDDRDAQPAYAELGRVIETALARLRSGEGQDSAQNSTQAMAHALLGFCRDHLGDAEGALCYYDAGLAAFPTNDALLVARGILRYGMDTPAAVQDFQKAIQFGSSVVWPYFFMAHHFLVNSRARECLTSCEQALSIHASDAVRANLHEWMAISRSDLGFPSPEVRTAFEEATRLDPANERIRKNYRAFEKSLGHDTSALRIWEKPNGADVRAYGRAEYRPAMAA
jgi:tetratricopeptide (TPR) repeat protein